MPYRSYFSSDATASVDSPDYQIFYRTEKNWNDFGYKFRVAIQFFRESKKITTLNGYLIPLVNGKIFLDIDRWISLLREQKPTDTLDFFSILESEDSYRRLRDKSNSKDEFLARLAAMKDLVFERNVSARPSQNFESVLKSEEFRLGVLRSPETYLAFNRAGRLLYAEPIPLESEAAVSFRFQTLLRGFEAMHDVRIAFSDESETGFNERVHAFIGINGSGKSRLLREIIIQIGRERNRQIETVFLNNDESFATDSRFETPVRCNRVLVFSSDYNDSFPTGVRSDSSFEYLYFNLISDKAQGALSLSRMMIDVIRMRDLINGSTRFSIFRSALEDYIDIEHLLLPLKTGADLPTAIIDLDAKGSKWIRASALYNLNEERLLRVSADVDDELDPLIVDAGNSEIVLSSGQRVYMRFALQCLSFIDAASLLILDEPETHLHPNLICEFVDFLYKIMSATRSVALIATHSSFVVRELPRQCVHIHKLEERKVTIASPRLQTLGASIDSICQFVFEDGSATKYHRRVALDIASRNTEFSDVLSSFKNQLNTEMLIEIRDAMKETDTNTGEVDVD
ncbi:AAA family ATPase [Paraburkholderia bannensis]|uniref:AAA family ATPase n=1 Tax=Paraburkholderia bannensis TaxID=765414 RepID=UPI002ABDB1C6|nr:AAA family ATPase [Paraburkholderia bannensis]